MRQRAITRDDLTKHNSRDVSFYSLSYGVFENERLKSKTELFSEQKLIEIERNASRMVIGDNVSQKVYRLVSPLEFAMHMGNGFLHWRAIDEYNVQHLIAKLISPDGTPQIKIVNENNGNCVIHNVCELPNM